MIGWYIVSYKIAEPPYSGAPRNMRYCAMDDYTSVIYGEGGQWTETEILGDRAIVKVRASSTTLTMLNGVYKRLPKDRLDDSLSSLSTTAKQALKSEALDMGYTIEELQEKFPNDLGTYTLREVLKFFATRRLKPRYDSNTDTIYIDGIVQTCRLLDSVNAEVQ